MCISCAIVSSIHSVEQDSTPMSSIHGFRYSTFDKISHLQAAAIIRERFLFKDDFYTRLYDMCTNTFSGFVFTLLISVACFELL